MLRSALATPGQRVRVALELPAAAGLLVCMALGFKHREIYALLMMAAPLLVALTSEARRRPAAWRLVGSFATAGAFALAPTSKRLDNHLVVASGAGAALLVLLSTRERQGSKAAGSGKASAPQAQQQRVQALTLVQLCSVALALAVAAFAHKGSPQPVLRAIAWLVYLTGPLLPLLSPPGWRQRWRALLLGLLAPFILVSICWEPLFFGAMAAAVDAWLAFDAAARGADRSRATAAGAAANGAAAGMQNTASAERQQAQSPSTPVRAAAEQALPATPATGGPMTRAQARARAPQLTPLKPRQRQPPSLQPQPPPAPAAALEGAPVGWVDLHRVLLFLLLIQMGFFGQGNTATIASFDLASVYRLVTVFNPFVMTAILLGKIFIPQVRTVNRHGALCTSQPAHASPLSSHDCTHTLLLPNPSPSPCSSMMRPSKPWNGTGLKPWQACKACHYEHLAAPPKYSTAASPPAPGARGSRVCDADQGRTAPPLHNVPAGARAVRCHVHQALL